MKEYPHIPSSLGFHGRACTAFYKYDGSNLRFSWSHKAGWNKQGTRTRLFDKTDEVFGEAVSLFQDTLSGPLIKIFKEEKLFRGAQQIIVFCEFLGDKSFAGQHIKEDPKNLILLDVNIHKRGFVSPSEFLDHFSCLGDRTAEMIYKGPLTKEFENQVRSGMIPHLNEGVVCKGQVSQHDRWMCKIKTDAYREKLKSVYNNGWAQYWE